MRTFVVSLIGLVLLVTIARSEEPVTRLSADTKKAVRKAVEGDARALAKIEKVGPLARKAADDVLKKVLDAWRFRGIRGRDTVEVDIGGHMQQYVLSSPKGYSPKKRWPLIVSLHGAGGNGSMEMSFIWAGQASTFRGFIAAPSGKPPGAQWFPEQIPFVLGLIRDVKMRASIDDDRVYVHGFSNGGNGAWYYAENHPGLFAAMCTRGGGNPTPNLLPNLLMIPTYIIHGENDSVIRVDSDRRDAKRLKDLGAEVVYTEVAGRAHEPFVNENEKVLAFFGKHARDPWRKELKFHTSGRGDFRCAWLEIPGGGGPTIEAKVEGNTIAIRGTRKVVLHLSDALVDLDQEVVVTLEGAEAFRGRVERRLSTLVADLKERFDRRGAAWARLEVGK